MEKVLGFNTVKILIIFTLLFFPFGCTHYYVPKQHPVAPGLVPDFSSNEPVAVSNGHKTGKMSLIGTQGAHKWMGDVQLWTDTAVGVLKNELQIRSISVTGDASKELTLTVTHANIYWGFASIRCIVTLEVETGEGYHKTFEGNNTSPWTLYRACDGSVTRAVEAMLNDEEILKYLKYSKGIQVEDPPDATLYPDRGEPLPLPPPTLQPE